MARPHSLMVWSVVFGFLAAASLYAAEAKDRRNRNRSTRRRPSQSRRCIIRTILSTERGRAKRLASRDPSLGRKTVRAEEAARNRSSKHCGRARTWRGSKRRWPARRKLCFIEAPLQEVLDSLKEQHRIEIQIDNKALEDVGIGTDSPVTVDLKGISLRSALNLMLRETQPHVDH